MKRTRVSEITIAALLGAIGIIIPIVSPFKIVIEPASFTLGSHVAIMVAMFLSPSIAVAVTLTTTLGFLISGFPLPIVFRAASHIVFVLVGCFILKKKPDMVKDFKKTCILFIFLSIIHSICEVAVVLPFYTQEAMSSWMYNVFGLIGIGTIVHSMVDFLIAYNIYKLLFLRKNTSK